MEVFVILFIVVLGVILIGSIMGMTSAGRISKLEQQNRNLNDRLRKLEAGRGAAETPGRRPSLQRQKSLQYLKNLAEISKS